MKSYKTNIPDIEIWYDKDNIVVISKNKLECLSNAAINGGRLTTKSIVNHHVPLNFNKRQLKEELNPVKYKYNLPDNMIGLLTAVKMKDAIIINNNINKVDYTLILTAGLTNTSIPLIEDSNQYEYNHYTYDNPGTINIILLINAKLSEHALVNLFIIITEIKTYLLKLLNIQTQDGKPATGTSTDTIVIGFTNKSQYIEWSGSSTKFGQSIGSTIFATLERALKKKGYYLI